MAVIEKAPVDDRTMFELLRLLEVGRIRVRSGRSAAWVAGTVDFSDLRTEYIGIVYEGLIDYELRRAPAGDPIVFLGVGRQPALPLSRLESLEPAALKKLLEAFKKDAKKAIDPGDDAADEDTDEIAEEEDDEAAVTSEQAPETETDSSPAVDEIKEARDEALAWAREAVIASGRVKPPRGKNPDWDKHRRAVEQDAATLVRSVVPPGQVYLVASGGLRKGSGSFYTRPALSVPLAHRTLEPLCYDREGDRLVPRSPQDILKLKVCEPAMGSGSFLVAALRYLADALARSLHHHGLIRADGQSGAVITLPFGTPAEAKEPEELLPLPPDDDRFDERLRAVLARHVVERCLYGVDRNPMAVELAKLSLWVETLDRELPFEFLDHKLKVGNSLVGCWLHLVEDYPIKALDREDSGGKSSDGTKWLKGAFKIAKGQLPDHIKAFGGATTFLDDVRIHPADLVATLRARFAGLHDLHRDQREAAYGDLLASDEYRTVRSAMDAWCALWFWPAGDNRVPLPRAWGALSAESRDAVATVAARERFFHWELEFPDVFGGEHSGFDAVLGNPPWETAQAESLEFFSRHDPLYRTYAKQDALRVQRELFADDSQIEREWSDYETSFRSLSHLVKFAAEAFQVTLPGGKSNAAAWAAARDRRRGYLVSRDPYRHQGTGKLYTYKLFLEIAHAVAARSGRLGMLVPAGVYTDKGAASLRRLFLTSCRWEWLYGFENRRQIFPIHSSYKFAPIVVQAGGSTARLRAAFMRHDIMEWERPDDHAITIEVEDIRRFSPSTWSFLEVKDERDLEIVEQLYADHRLLGEYCANHGVSYSQEFNMTSASKHFTARAKLPTGLLDPEDDTRDPRARARLRVAGFVPLYEGKSFYLHNPYALGKGQKDSIGKFVRVTVADKEVGEVWRAPRLLFRDIARSTDQRTLLPVWAPPGTHGNKAPSLDGADEPLLAALFGSLTLDYILRMKVSASLNWFYVETLPVPDWSGSTFEAYAADLVVGLNAVGADFPEPAGTPLIRPPDRLAARLVVDALVADLYGLDGDDLGHIATRFPIYDKHAGEHRYTALVVPVYEGFRDGGYEGATARATELAQARKRAGVGFGLDELWVPPGGWEVANEEACQILADAGDLVT